MKWAKTNFSNTTAQNFPKCRVILHSFKCNSAHLYQRLHFHKIKYLFQRP